MGNEDPPLTTDSVIIVLGVRLRYTTDYAKGASGTKEPAVDEGTGYTAG